MIKREDVYRIGRIGKPHGIKGEVTFRFDDDVFDRVESDYIILDIDGILVPFFMEEYRFRSDEAALVKFCDIDTQERAATLNGCDVYFERSAIDTDNDEITSAEIVGYTIIDDATGQAVGVIAAMDSTTVNTLFELEDGRLIPAPDELITDVDKPSRTITMTLPEGLLDI